MTIDQNTILCCSFAKKAGSFGCFIHNNAFEYLNLNYIYKSFSVDDISKAIEAMKTLDIKGAGITMPYKKEVLNFVDDASPSTKKIGACNTVVNKKGHLFGENTDYLGLKEYFSSVNPPKSGFVSILGNGGMSLAVQAACNSLDINFEIITRNELSKVLTLKNRYIFNATPLTDLEVSESNNLIHANVKTLTGMYLAILQASFQFNLYTNKEFPVEFIFEIVNKKFNINLKL